MTESAYRSELRSHWRPMIGAMIGTGSGMLFNAYSMPLLTPKLMAAFGWSRADIAVMGILSLVMAALSPVTGILADRFGAKKVVTIGVFGMPVAYVLLSRMSGSLNEYFWLVVLQMLAGSFTASPVYTRLVAERFDKARGFALGCVVAGPPVAGLLSARPLKGFIDSYGWSNGYLLIGAVSFALGLVALVLIPKQQAHTIRPKMAVGERRAAFATIFKSPLFWLVWTGMFLASMPHSATASPLLLVLEESGAPHDLAATMIQVFALGVIIGRFGCGLTLDRFPMFRVAAIAVGVPALGLALLVSSFDATWTIALSVLMLALAQGAEGDIAAFIVAKRFDIKIYSVVMSMMGIAIATGSATGSMIMKVSLDATKQYANFIWICAAAGIVSAGLFLLLNKREKA